MREVLAVINSVSAVVQLVDFSSKCISKGVELYQPVDGVLDHDGAIESAAHHFITFRARVQTHAICLDDVVLLELCRAVAEASSEVLEALAKVKIQDCKTKGKTLRKAIKGVWGKERILDLHHRLSSIRSKLVLHISTSIRQQLESLKGDIEAQLRNTTEVQKRIIDAVLQNRSVFEVTLQSQTALIQNVSGEIRPQIDCSREVTCIAIYRMVAESIAVDQNEHNETGQEIRVDGAQAATWNQEFKTATTQQIEETIEVAQKGIVSTTAEIDQAELCQPQSLNVKLEQALLEISYQLTLRKNELKEVLEEFNSSWSKKSKEQRFERSKTVTAAILALETMSRTLKNILLVLQDPGEELLENTQTADWWAITGYARWPLEEQPQVTSHDVYFSYFYQGVFQRSAVVDIKVMEKRWKFQPGHQSDSAVHGEGFVIDETPCSSKCLWLLASLALALETHMTPEDAPFVILSKALDATYEGTKRPSSFTNGHLTSQLKSDINYWSSFARSRGMQKGMRRETFDYASLQEEQRNDLHRLFLSLLGTARHDMLQGKTLFEEAHCTILTGSGPANTVVGSLQDIGLPFTIHPLDDLNVTVEFGIPNSSLATVEDVSTNNASWV